MPHANWHRTSATLLVGILRAITQELQVTFQPPSSGFPNIVDGLPTAIANTLALVNSVFYFIGPTSSLNFCRIFELAKFNGENSPSASFADVYAPDFQKPGSQVCTLML